MTIRNLEKFTAGEETRYHRLGNRRDGSATAASSAGSAVTHGTHTMK